MGYICYITLKFNHMKTLVKAAIFFASAMVMFSSCLKEQTGLSVEDIPGVAKISGKLMIDEGQAYEDGRFVELLRPAANYQITAKVDNNTLSPTSAQGNTEYTVTTNEDGTFEIVIPAVDAGVNVELVAPAFLGVQSQLSSLVINDGQMLFENVEGKYSYNKNLTGLRPGDVEIVNGVYSFTASDATVTLSDYVDLCIAVGFGLPAPTTSKKEEYQTLNPSYVYNGEIVPADDVDVIVNVTYNSNEDGSYKGRTISYPGTTDSDGILLVSIPCTSKEAMKAAHISVQARECLGQDDFTYYALAKHSDDYLKNIQRSCDIPAGTYTFKQTSTDCKSSYNFDFFMPVVKLVMTINQIETGADEGIVTRFDDTKENNATFEENYRYYYSYFKSDYVGFWTVDNFEIEVY